MAVPVEIKPVELSYQSFTTRGVDTTTAEPQINYFIDALKAIDPKPYEFVPVPYVDRGAEYRPIQARQVDVWATRQLQLMRPYLETPIGLTPQQEVQRKKDLAAWNARKLQRESAVRFAIDVFNRHQNEFTGTSADLNNVLKNYSKALAKDVELFKTRYSNEDVTWLGKGVKVATDALIQHAYITTPAPKHKLFGFIPIKVSSALEQFIGVSIAAATAGITSAVSAATEVGSTAGVAGSEVAPAVSTAPSTVTVGSYSADLGIRGAQAANLASAGGYPGAALGFGAPSLEASSVFAPAATPLAAVTPQALRLGITGTTIQSGFLDTAIAKLSNTLQSAKNYVLENPTQSALAGAGAGFTLKRVSESQNPLGALINTIAGAVGLPPIVKPPGGNPGPVGSPFAGVFGGGGGAGGAGFGQGGPGLGSTWLLWILLGFGVILLAVKLRR